MKIRLAGIFVALLMVNTSHAIEPFTVSDIRIEGVQRISAGTVFNYLPIKVGDQINDSNAQEAIRVLYKTGFFKDVQLEQEGTVLVIAVQERPSIAKISFSGNKEIDDDALKEGMSQIGFTEGRIFNKSVLDKVSQELKTQYFSRGRYGADIQATVTPLERNRVAIAIDITEGDVAKIKSVNVIGNKAFKEKDLLNNFEQGIKGTLSFFSKKDQYSKQKLAADLETLRSYYQDRGYLDFKITSTQVSITPDKKDIYITIGISEGEKYTVGSFKFSGNTIVGEDELLDLVTLVAGDVFSRKEISTTSKAVTDRLANEGYAFANLNAIPEIDRENRTVGFTFFVDAGRRVYVRRINVSGNTVTRDIVIRREMRQLEGGWFSAAKIRRSRIRLQRLGFFDDVNIETPAVPGSPDQVDINVSVKERATGALLFGVGFSDAQGILLQASVQQRNLFGTGKELLVSLDNSSVTDVISVSYRNPYYTQDGISRGFSVFRRTVDAGQANTAAYIQETLGAGVNYRFPISEFNSLNAGFTFEQIDLTATSQTPPEILAAIVQSPSNDIYKLNSSIAHDTRDSILYPTIGTLHRLSLEVGLPGSDQEYYKGSYRFTRFQPITKNLVFKATGELGYGDSYADTTELPFFKNFYAGGTNSVRGYRSRSLGPRDSSANPNPLGGDKRVLINAEVLFPVPTQHKSKDKRLSVFVDGGMVWGPDETIDLGGLRYAAGFAFNWFSPLGPLSLSYAFPINDQAGDDTENFQITLGRFFR